MRKHKSEISSNKTASEEDSEDSASTYNSHQGEMSVDGKNINNNNLYVKRVQSLDPEYEQVPEVMQRHENMEDLASCQNCHKPMDHDHSALEVKGQEQRRLSSDSNTSSSAKKEHQLKLIRQMLAQQKQDTLPKTKKEENSTKNGEKLEKKKMSDSTPSPVEEFHKSKKNEVLVADKSIVPVKPDLIQKKPEKVAPEDKLFQSFKIRSFQCIENSVRRILWNLGSHLTKAPILFILIPIFFCSLSTIGLIVRRNNLFFDTPFKSYYYSSQNDEPQASMFNDSNLRYDALQRMSGSDFAVLFKAKDNGNVLQEEIVDAYLTLKQAVENIKVVGQGKAYKYSTLCRHSQETCEMDVVQSILNSGKNLKFKFPEMDIPRPGKNDTLTTIFLGETFGGVQTDEDGHVSKAAILAMYFKLKKKITSRDVSSYETDMTLPIDEVIEQWDQQFQDVILENSKKVKEASLSWWSFDAFSIAVKGTFKSIYVYLSISLSIIVIGCLGACFVVQGCACKIWILAGLSGAVALIFTVGSAISADIGITGYINPATFPAYFTLAASCIFFLINMMQSWHKYNNVIVNPMEKLRFILSWEISGFCLICVTLILSNAICAIATGINLFRSVCQLMAFGFIFLLLLLLLFYNCLLYLLGRHEATSSEWFQKSEKQPDVSFAAPILKRYNLRDMEILHRKFLDTSDSLMSRKIGKPLSSVYTRYIALLIFCLYLIFSAWGCSMATIELNENQYVRPSTDKDINRFLNDYDKYYSKYDNYVEIIFGNPVDYYSPKIRAAINDMLNWVEYEQHLADRVVSWLRDFSEFEKTSIYLVNRDTFVPVIDLIFLRDERYKRYTTDLALGKYNEQIVGSRMYIELNKFGTTRKLEIVKYILAKAKEVNLPVTVKTPSTFLLSHDVEIQSDILSVFAITICISAVIVTVVFAQPVLTLLILLCTISVSAGTIGFASLWNVPVNAANEATVLAAISYTIILCLSTCHYFNNAQVSTTKNRLLYTCQSVFHGAIFSTAITIVAFLPLLTIDCQFVVHQAKIIFLHFTFSLLHCCLFLPPCLILCCTYMPTFCRSVQEMCRESCCCCDAEEDATSIYYLPTGGQSVDPLYVQQFFRLKFREDIGANSLIMQHEHPALPPPPRREMITAPPNMHLPSRGATYHDDRMEAPPRRRRRRSAEKGTTTSEHKSSRRLGRNKKSRSTSPGNVSSVKSFDEPSDPENTVNGELTGEKHHGRSRRASSGTKSLDESFVIEEDVDHINNAPFESDVELEHVDNDEEDQNTTGEIKSYEPSDPKSKNKISYAKWTKETPLNAYATERVTAEKYTIEGDGGRLELPPDWKRFWLKGDLRNTGSEHRPMVRNQEDANDSIGMVPVSDHHRPLHVRNDMPYAPSRQGHPFMMPDAYYDGRVPPRVYALKAYPQPPVVHQFVPRPMQPSKMYRKPAYW